MQIKFSTFRSVLQHSEQFERENKSFLSDIEEKLETTLVEADKKDYDCDLKLLFVQTGGSEGIFLKNLNELQPPFYLLTNGGNNSLAASLEILTYAKLHGVDGEILHGDVDYIAQRIAQLAQIATVKRKLAATLGVVGTPSDWLIASIPDENLLKQKLNINLKFLPLSQVESGINTDNTFGNDNLEMQKAEAVYDNLKHLVISQGLSGLTLRCFDLLSSVKMTGCLALAKLNAENITATCEGDVMAMVSMFLVQTLFDQPSFQANPSRLDTTKNEIVFAHCTVPLNMVDSFSYKTHFESGIGIAIKGEMKKMPVTVFRLAASLDKYSILQGHIVGNMNENNLCRTQIRVTCDESVTELLKTPCGNHHIVFYGHHKQELETTLKLLLN